MLEERDGIFPAAPCTQGRIRVVDRRIEPEIFGVRLVPTADTHEVDAWQTGPGGHLAPARNRRFRVGDLERAVHDEDGLAIDLHVAPVVECRQQGIEMALVVFGAGIGLLDQYPVLGAVPDAAPGFVGPAQAEREIRFARREHFGERPFEHAFAVAEPVVVIAEALDAVLPRKVSLRLAGFRHAQIVESQIGRHVGLVMPREPAPCLGSIGPFGETLAPEFVIVRNRIVLGQIKGDEPWHCSHGASR